MKRPEQKKPPMVIAMQIAHEVTSIGVSFALFPLLGYWLDSKLGTTPWLVIVGAILGFVVGMTLLVDLSRRLNRPKTTDSSSRTSSESDAKQK
ncbi:MAG: AtpZ/AtpI family protein [Planctomycetaceae bacterium]|nr:AtpZ/AtpI family protein [Planctomycetaceae bacterium]